MYHEKSKIFAGRVSYAARLIRLAGAMALLLAGCAEPEESEASAMKRAQESTAPTAATDAGIAGPCALPALPSGAPLAPFRDDRELHDYLVAQSARCAAAGADAGPRRRPPGLALGAGAIASSASPSEAPQVGATALPFQDRLLVLSGYRLLSIDVSVPGAPRLADAFVMVAGESLRSLFAPPRRMFVIDGLVYVVAEIRTDRLWAPQTVASAEQVPLPPAYVDGLELSVFRLRDDKLERISRIMVDRGVDVEAVRVVDGEVVLPFGAEVYEGMGYDAGGFAYARPYVPWTLHYDAETDRFSRERPLLEARDVLRPRAAGRGEALLGVLRCRLSESAELTCRARAFLAQSGARVHTSAHRVYFWPWSEQHVYALDLATDAVTVHRVSDRPASTVAMHEIGQVVHVAESSAAKNGPLELRLWSVPLTTFDARGEQQLSPRILWRDVRSARAEVAAQRFVGSTYIAHVFDPGTFIFSLPTSGKTPSAVVMQDLRVDAQPRVMPGPENLRIDPVGPEHALLFGAPYLQPRSSAGTLELWTLASAPTLGTALTLAEPVLPVAGIGVFALTQRDGAATIGLTMSTASTQKVRVHFFLTGGAQLRELGAFPSEADASAACSSYCAEQPQPIFVGDRTFVRALGKLTEVTLEPAVAPIGMPLALRPTFPF